MELKNTFVQGRMNKDLDERLLPKGEYRHAENIRVVNSEGSDVGAIENVLGNKILVDYDFGESPKTIGMLSDSFDNKIYWWVVSDSGCFLMEYDTDESIYVVVLHDTRVGNANVLNLNEYYLITGANIIINSDNNSRFLAWTDNLNPPRYINIERAKTYGENGFSKEDISLIKAPPINPPDINLTDTENDYENHIEERFLRFGYRYEYLDGEYSAFSPFSETAFQGKSFLYDYSTSSNESMVNNFSQITIAFNTGNSLVKNIELLFKESGKNTVNIIESFNKEDEGWDDNETVNFKFSNNKVYKVLPESQLGRLFDAVPLKAKAQEVIGNRLIFGNYTENYDLLDYEGNDLNLDFSLTYTPTAITENTPTQSLKSNRDYEVGIVYLDEEGRMTTVLTTKENTVYIPNSDSVNQNKLQVTLNSTAPSFASYYRFFIKQSKYDYDVIVPTLFYEDGVYVWIKLEGGEINKISEGDFIYVKSDTQEILPEIVQTKVLEIKTQERNFLEDPSETDTKQLAGTYFKIKPSKFRISEDDFTLYQFDSYDSSSNKNDNPIRGNIDVIEPIVFYGEGLNDATEGGAFSGSDDTRYIIEIDSVGGTDTFQWSDDDGDTFTTGVSITGAAQALSNGVTITFGAVTGHTLDDRWIISAKNSADDGFGGSENSKAYAIYKSVPSNGNVNVDDVIEGGARITIEYDEYNENTQYFEEVFTSSTRYANLEEWYFEDNVDLGISDSRIWFRRGNVGSDSNTNAKYFEQDPTGDMCMIILSSGTQNNDADSRVKVQSKLEIFQSEKNIIFETKPSIEDSDKFFEIGRTYVIDENGYHLGYDDSDTDQDGVTSAILNLPSFNCISWGNAFESYKIKDLFNANSFKIDTRPSSTVENYRENKRIASLTYSEVYEQTTNYNAINEFNLYNENYKDLDDKYNSIQKLYTEDTNLIVFQEDKVHNILYSKDILYDADGQGNVRQSSNVLGQEVPYTGEYGISKNPESFAVFGRRKYFTDSRRGCSLRLSNDGIYEISENGMTDWFRDLFREYPNTKKLGAFDTYTHQYVLHIDDTELPDSTVIPCGVEITAFELENNKTITYEVGSVAESMDLEYVVEGEVNLIIRDDSGVLNTLNSLIDVSGTQEVTRVDTSSKVYIDIEVVSELPTVSLKLPCPIPSIPPVIANDDLELIITGNTIDINVLANDIFIDPVTVTIDTPAVEGVATVNPDKTIEYAHGGANTNPDSFVYMIDDGNSTDTATVNITVKASGGGGGATGQEFNISSDSYYNVGTNGEGACGFILDAVKYHDGVFLQPTLADKVYNDVDKTIPFDGGDEYYLISGGIAIRIISDGTITGYWICGAGEA